MQCVPAGTGYPTGRFNIESRETRWLEKPGEHESGALAGLDGGLRGLRRAFALGTGVG